MVFTPGQNSLEVEVEATGVSAFRSAMDGAAGSLLSVRSAALVAGGAIAALSTALIVGAVQNARAWNAEIREMRKVMDPAEVEAVSGAVIELSNELPLVTERLAGIATEARRFGIEGEENIIRFTEAVAKMAFATDVPLDEAGKSFARLIAVTDAAVEEVENLGSAINTMGQTSATSSGEIVDGMLRSAAALTQLGLTAPEIVGLQASINEVSESAERAGTRLRRLAQEMEDPARLREIARGFLNIGAAQTELSIQVDATRVDLQDERAALVDLESQLAETSAELRGLRDAHDELGDSIAENRIAIEEIRLDAARAGRELTEEEKAQIAELELANRELRLEQMKTARQMDDTQEAMEDQQAAVDAQTEAVTTLETELANLETEAAEDLAEQFEEAPLDTLQEWARAMREGGDEADVLRENLSAVSIQALSALGQNIDDTAEGTGDMIDNLSNANEAFLEGTSLQREYEIEAASLGAEMQRLRNSISNATSVIGNQYIPHLRSATRATTGMTEAIRDFVEAGGGQMIAGGLLAAAVGGIALAFVGLSPILLGVMGLVGALAAMWQTNFGGIRDVTASVLQRIRELFSEHVQPLLAPGGEIEQIMNGFREFWAEWGDEIEAIWSFVWAAIGGILTFAVENLLVLMRVFLNILTGDWEEAWLILADFVVSTLNGLLSFAAEWGSAFIDALLARLPESLQTAVRDRLNLEEGFRIEAPTVANPFGEELARRQVETQLEQTGLAQQARAQEREGLTIQLDVTGDDELAGLIRRNAEVVNNNEASQDELLRGRPEGV